VLVVLLALIAFICLRFIMFLPLMVLYPGLFAVLSINAVKSFVQPILEARTEEEKSNRDESPE
jgi:hypothetical protein